MGALRRTPVNINILINLLILPTENCYHLSCEESPKNAHGLRRIIGTMPQDQFSY